MALVVKDRVRETSTTTGTGTFTLAGAVTGYQAFSAVGDGNTTYYTIYLQGGNEWEVGIGTYTASGTTLSRDTILASSNAGSAVNFSAGTKDVFVTYPAGRSVWYDSATNVTLNALTVTGALAANGGTTIGDASGDAFTINSSAVSTPNGLNFDSNTFVIDAANDRVGIGTNSPFRKLDIALTPAAQVTGATIRSVGGTTSIGDETSIDFQVFSTSYYNGRISGYVESIIGNGKGGLKFYTSSAGNSINATPSVTIDSSGGFITTPTTNGHAVFNEDGVDADFRVESDANTHRLFVDAGADTVLMGTTTNTNSSKLVVDGTISETVSSTQYLVASQFDIGTAANEIPLNQYLGNLAYQDAGSIAGQVGLSAGTAALPSLVSATDTDTGMWFPAANTLAWSTGGTERIRVTSGGTFQTSLDASIYGVTVGRGAGAVAGNTVLGSGALAANVSAGGSVAIGFEALKAMTTGDNCAVGYQALLANNTGQLNSAFGAFSLKDNLSGSYNTAYGRDSLKSNTTASWNTAVGYQAAYAGETAAFITAVGTEALRNNTGSLNTAVGYQALYLNTSGQFNTAMGVESLENNTTASGNSAYGVSSLRSNITGSSNTAMGQDALLYNTTASNNTAVGYQSLYISDPALTNATSLTSGNNGTVYTIISVGSTDFTAIGAASNTAGITFTKSGGTGTGTGTVKQNVDAKNTAIGFRSGYEITTGTKNTIIGSYNGNQGGLDIRTASNYIVLSDGDGNPRMYHNGTALTVNGRTVVGSAFIGDNATAGNNVGLAFGGLTIYPTDGAGTLTNQTLNLGSSTYSFDKIAVTGVIFPATQSASSNANTLDDYEEGDASSSLAIAGTTSAGTATYAIKTGRYVKVGSLVTVYGYLSWTGHTGTGNMQITGLPFVAFNVANLFGGVSIGYFEAISLTAGNVAVAYVIPNTSSIDIYQYPTGGGSSSAVPIDAAGAIIFSVTYSA